MTNEELSRFFNTIFFNNIISRRKCSHNINSQQNLQQHSHQISRLVANNCETTSETAPSMAINVPIKLDVLFDFDSANIKSSYQPQLQELAEFMAVNSDVKTVLEGHTDSTGPASYNLRLSQARAEAVKTSLVN